MRLGKRPIGLLFALAALLVSACGTTTSLEEQQAALSNVDASSGGRVAVGDVSGGDPLAAVDPGSTAGAGGGATTPAAATAGSSGSAGSAGAPSGSGGGSAPTAAGGGATAASEKPFASAPGVTATEIKIGLIYDKSAGYVNTALGYGGIGQVDSKRAYDTLIADINNRGGVLGRKLVPVYHVFDSAGPDANTPPEVNEQRICTTFTENRVFLTFVTGGETFTRCMNKLGVVRVGNGAVDSQLLAESPLLVVLNVTLDRAARFTTARLAERGFYAEGRNGVKPVKVGLIRYDAPEFERAAKVVKDELAKQGIQLAGDIAIKEAETVDQIQDETTATRAAALQFKSDGITNVQFLSDGRAYLELTFMQNAEKQLYQPRYGLNSSSGGQALATLLGSDAQAQLAQSLQVGWFPIFDVERASYSGDNTTQAFQRCIKLLTDAGERFTEGDPTRNKEAQASFFCDLFSYVTTAATKAGVNLTPQTFMERGVATIDGLDSAATYVLSTSKRRDGYAGVKYAKWVDGCSCFRYESPTVYPV